MTALLGVMHARDLAGFRQALHGFAVPGQTMLAVEAAPAGGACQVIAAHLPRRTTSSLAGLAVPPEHMWSLEDLVPAAQFALPAPDVLVSANNRPPPLPVPAGFFFSPPDRVQRMRALLGGEARLGRADLERLQQDVLMPGALRLRDGLVARIAADQRSLPAVRALVAWDGSYAPDSRGALVYEVLVAEVAQRLDRPQRLAPLAAIWTARALIAEEIMTTPADRLAPLLRRAVGRAARALRRWQCWGGIHRMRLRHHFAAVPLLGRRYVFCDLPAGGGNDTLNKTGHRLARGRHAVRYGACARFIADLAEPDANEFVLLGGQDGWLGSPNFADQVDLWQRGRYLPLPLAAESARAWPHHTRVEPLP
jgi:penicillin amidase